MPDEQISLSKQPVPEDQDHQIKSISPPEKLKQLESILRKNLPTNVLGRLIEICNSVNVLDFKYILIKIFEDREHIPYKSPEEKPRKKIKGDGDCRRGM